MDGFDRFVVGLDLLTAEFSCDKESLIPHHSFRDSFSVDPSQQLRTIAVVNVS